jgi:hypothetical protein
LSLHISLFENDTASAPCSNAATIWPLSLIRPPRMIGIEKCALYFYDKDAMPCMTFIPSGSFPVMA